MQIKLHALSLFLLLSIQSRFIFSETATFFNDMIAMYPDATADLKYAEVSAGSTNFCSFDGVTCVDGKVTKLELYPRVFNGCFPASISNLVDLDYLYIANAGFKGEIPKLSKLVKLRRLDLNSNEFTGNLPDMRPLINLILMDIANNKLTGSIVNLPTSNTLEYIYLYNNKLDGHVQDLSHLVNLKTIKIFNNSLQGCMPTLALQKNLMIVNASKNWFITDIDMEMPMWTLSPNLVLCSFLKHQRKVSCESEIVYFKIGRCDGDMCPDEEAKTEKRDVDTCDRQLQAEQSTASKMGSIFWIATPLTFTILILNFNYNNQF